MLSVQLEFQNLAVITMKLNLWIAILFWYSCRTLVSSTITSTGENLFVYLSQSSGHNASLIDLCNEDAIDVVILGFVRSFTGIGGYPKIDFGPSLCNATRPENEILAPGLAVCLELGQEVKQCQEKGKKIFLSIGGSTSNTSFEAGKRGRDEAVRAARLMWNLFGEGMESPSLRPFGPDVIIDGYDIGKQYRRFRFQIKKTNTLDKMMKATDQKTSTCSYRHSVPTETQPLKQYSYRLRLHAHR